MPRIPETYNIGNRENVTPEKLLEMLEDMYQTLAKSINQKPNIYTRTAGGIPTNASVDDNFVSDGDLNVNITTGKVEMAVEHDTATTVVWKEL